MNKFYGSFNNIMPVTEYNKNEMASLHLVRSYCVPAALYGCETWHLDRNDYHRLNVIWNNSFRKNFSERHYVTFAICYRNSVCLSSVCL